MGKKGILVDTKIIEARKKSFFLPREIARYNAKRDGSYRPAVNEPPVVESSISRRC